MLHRFTTSQWLPYPRAFVFGFLASPENLPRLMPAWQMARIEEAQIVPPPAPAPGPLRPRVAAGKGSLITISFRPIPFSPVRLSWEALISDFAWNERFCDRQLHGPFGEWEHCHSAKDETREGIAGTLVTDDVHYAMTLGFAGEIAHTLFAERQVRSIFRHRQQQMEKLLAELRRSQQR
ncbi:SRPBCC family protein [Silvibacterium acidisoli]|uniref:SRPBCC family protein n=1 Tax=Acidobacteriaceae bacterium ZG23-2 TaxID=2883246 RepID=UPI00406CDB3D